MKYIYFILLIFISNIFLSCSKPNLNIVQTENGYDIYKENELMLEFTQQNCDEKEIELLKYIYDVTNDKKVESKKYVQK